MLTYMSGNSQKSVFFKMGLELRRSEKMVSFYVVEKDLEKGARLVASLVARCKMLCIY